MFFFVYSQCLPIALFVRAHLQVERYKIGRPPDDDDDTNRAPSERVKRGESTNFGVCFIVLSADDADRLSKRRRACAREFWVRHANERVVALGYSFARSLIHSFVRLLTR